MPMMVKEGKTGPKVLVPAGMKQAVCYDVWDLGVQKNEYQGRIVTRPQIILTFELEDIIPDGELAGKRYTIGKFFTRSLHKKSTLRPFLEAWRGQPFTGDELKGFDLEYLVGVNAFLNIIHEQKPDGTVKAKIASCGPITKSMAKLVPQTERSIPNFVQEFQAKAVKPEVAMEQGEEVPF